MLVIVPHNHRYWLEEGGRWEFFWISMSGQEAVRIHRTIQATTGPVLRLRPETIERIAECSLRLIEGEGETPGAASAIAYEAAVPLYDDVFGSPGGRRKRGQPLRRVVEHVRANLDKPLTVSISPTSLASAARISRACSRQAKACRRPSSCCRSACGVRRGFCPATRICRSRRSPWGGGRFLDQPY